MYTKTVRSLFNTCFLLATSKSDNKRTDIFVTLPSCSRMSEEEDTQWEYPANGSLSEYQDLNFPVRNEYPEMTDPKFELKGLNEPDQFNSSAALDGFNSDRPNEQEHSPMQVSLAILEEISKSFHKQVHFKM
jgi:hypothetical protein